MMEKTISLISESNAKHYANVPLMLQRQAIQDDIQFLLERIDDLEKQASDKWIKANSGWKKRAEAAEADLHKRTLQLVEVVAERDRLREVMGKVILVPLKHHDKHLWVQRMCDMLSTALRGEGE